MPLPSNLPAPARPRCFPLLPRLRVCQHLPRRSHTLAAGLTRCFSACVPPGIAAAIGRRRSPSAGMSLIIPIS